MSLFEISRDGFAVVGLLGGLVLLYQRLFAKKLDEDAPIRVKGGSVSIESEKEWEDDTSDDDDRDYFSRGRVNRLAVRVGTLAQPGTDVHTGNKVVVTVQNGEDEQDTYKFKIRGNGAVRVVDKQKKFAVKSANKMTLEDLGPRIWIRRVVVKLGKDEIFSKVYLRPAESSNNHALVEVQPTVQ